MRYVWITVAGLAGGFVGNGICGVLFSSDVVRSILYDPHIQGPLFLEITPSRNIPLSVVGLVVLSIIHAGLFFTFRPSIPGHAWWQKGAFWGLSIWLMYWLFQEWFIYHTLLGEPILLNLFELSILLCGSIMEGIVIAFVLRSK